MESDSYLKSMQYKVIVDFHFSWQLSFHLQEMAMNNNCVGWVQNTKRGTVIGQLQGPPESVKTLKDWLKKTGSPKSRIVRCVFKNEIEIKKLEHSEFLVIK
eukprot:XP_014780059.1 PREDICTED: acylphosphatase-1-like [Octopus bimaculoides]